MITTAYNPVSNTAEMSADAQITPKSVRPQVVYCVRREALSSVFHSQVLTPVACHCSDVDVQIVAHVPVGHLWRRRWRSKLDLVAQQCEGKGVPLTWLPSAPARWPWMINDTRRLSAWLKRQYGSQRVILHCRNATMTNIALDAKSTLPHLRIIYDCRGAESAELEQQHAAASANEKAKAVLAARVLATRQAESRAATQADHILCVSEAMRDYLIDTHHVPERKLSVVPCCLPTTSSKDASTDRDEIRRRLGIDDRLVVTYCGSLAWYQLPHESLRIVRLLQQTQPDVHFLAITTQPEQMWTEIDRAGLPRDRITVTSVPAGEVAGLLSAGDLGLLLRDRSLVNRVASPVKFGEYMSAGLPVAISEHVGDYSTAVSENGLGVVVGIDDSDEAISRRLQSFIETFRRDSTSFKQRCRDFAATELSWSTHLPTTSRIYHTLAGD